MGRSPTATELYAKELDELRFLFEAGRWPALFDAVRYCHTVRISLPEWAILPILNLIQDRHFEDGTAGGYGSASGKFSMDYAHWSRWNAVRYVLLMNGLKDLPTGRGRPLPGKKTKAGILKEAADWLANKPIARIREPGQIGDSFNLVEESLAKGEARFQFNLLFTV